MVGKGHIWEGQGKNILNIKITIQKTLGARLLQEKGGIASLVAGLQLSDLHHDIVINLVHSLVVQGNWWASC